MWLVIEHSLIEGAYHTQNVTIHRDLDEARDHYKAVKKAIDKETEFFEETQGVSITFIPSEPINYGETHFRTPDDHCECEKHLTQGG